MDYIYIVLVRPKVLLVMKWLLSYIQGKQNIQIYSSDCRKYFREDLRKLNIRFEGRGKHIRKAQEDIIANTDLINQKAAELLDKIEEVQYNLCLLYTSDAAYE